MARGVNKVIIVGNLGNDPETRYTPSGNAITNISVATSESWKDKQTGERQERTEWHRVTFFNKLAEIAGEYLRKGAKVYLEGSLRTRKWQDQSGQDKYSTDIVASELQMLGDAGNQQQQNNNNDYQQPNQRPAKKPPVKQQPQNTESPSQSYSHQSPPPGNYDNFDDDIPF